MRKLFFFIIPFFPVMLFPSPIKAENVILTLDMVAGTLQEILADTYYTTLSGWGPVI